MITGRITGRDESFNYFEAEGTTLYCPGRDGEFRRAVFSSNDVILSKEDVKSSARNSLEAEIISLEKKRYRRYCKFESRIHVSGKNIENIGI